MSGAQHASGGGGRGLVLSPVLLDSDAWRGLTASARAVYVDLANIANKGGGASVPLSVRSAAARCRINRDTAARAFNDLRDARLIGRNATDTGWLVNATPESDPSAPARRRSSAVILRFERRS